MALEVRTKDSEGTERSVDSGMGEQGRGPEQAPGGWLLVRRRGLEGYSRP